MSKSVFATVAVSGGTITLSGSVVQATWNADVLGRTFNPPAVETWIAPDLRNARWNFVNLCKMFS